MITIRVAVEDDARILADISRQTFYDTFAAQNSEENMEIHMQEYYALDKILAELKDPYCTFLLAYEGDQLAGYAKLNEHAKEEAKSLDNPIEIERIYSCKEMIGKGVGKKLMENCLAAANEKKKNTVWLGVWESNSRAIEFYTRWGFEKFGEHNFPVGDDPQKDWLMKRSIAGDPIF
jgi:ribosomal protein S18 acetylase RimI-like enzyme